MDTGTQHVVSLLRALADDIEAGQATRFEVHTSTPHREPRMIDPGYTRGLVGYEIKVEIDPNAPRRCPACRNALLGGKCSTVECPVDAADIGPLTWYVDSDGKPRHSSPCGGLLIHDTDEVLCCTKCGVRAS